MLSLVLVVAAFGLIEAKPALIPTFSQMVIGGEDASPGEFPWQLSQQRLGTSWSHSCGASLLSANKALSAAHCVSGAAVSVLRVIAGLHDRTDSNGVTSTLTSYTTHENYNDNSATYANDIAILNLATAIAANGNTIVYATLPANNNNNYAGDVCVISGWGRTGNSNALPTILQKGDMTVMTTAECEDGMSGVSGVTITGNHICITGGGDTSSCNGDSGGPLNCEGQSVVAGVTSWGISSALGNCLPAYPSVYTRTSAYLAWIAAN